MQSRFGLWLVVILIVLGGMMALVGHVFAETTYLLDAAEISTYHASL